MSETWKQWEGQVVGGEFPLLRFLGGSKLCGVFLTERHDGQQPIRAAIKLIPAAPENDGIQLSAWQQAAELSHPHLIPIYEMGRCELDGAPFLYVVMECAEENLAQVLPDRALTPAEARTMLESVLDVLGYLHGKGFVHGHIKPGNIMASGDQLKVSSDGLRRAGESLDGREDLDAYDPPENGRGIIPEPRTLSPAGDVWSLGMTLVETLTQNLPIVRTTEQLDPLFPQTLPEPFLDIARHCLIRHPQGRWTVPQIAARLEGRVPVAQAQTALPVPQSAARSSRPIVQRRNYGVHFAVGFVLVLAAILATAKLLRHHADTPQVPTATIEQPVVPPAPKQAAPPAQKHPTKESRPSIAEEERKP
jgi:serine/threonine protein kinase